MPNSYNPGCAFTLTRGFGQLWPAAVNVRRDSFPERGGDGLAQRREDLLGEPGISAFPGSCAPGGMRQRETARQVRPEVADVVGHRSAAEDVGQSVSADEQSQADVRHQWQEPGMPEWRTFEARRGIAAVGKAARIAQAHG